MSQQTASESNVWVPSTDAQISVAVLLFIGYLHGVAVGAPVENIPFALLGIVAIPSVRQGIVGDVDVSPIVLKAVYLVYFIFAGSVVFFLILSLVFS